MRSSILAKDDISNCMHERLLKIGKLQSMTFLETDLPPFFDSKVPKYDVIKSDNKFMNKDQKKNA